MKIKSCEYCGANLGGEVTKYQGDDPIVCENSECVKWAREEMQNRMEDARERAIEDEFHRYR